MKESELHQTANNECLDLRIYGRRCDLYSWKFFYLDLHSIRFDT